ncbi:hypothetical protein [Mucilaginibacter sp. FT3.2]|uniref:hypothetical protein n=1 Tax=Mucilaginibacter sp. FT3.2 TaxID=2723090 RepID=UPI00161FC514|nr:hypothetical protein [Mucilaginibacter sp. FT3.2]MBB6231686.1 hypothetical protein [Mucilaginibacter sp. FT3.2]
MKHFFILIIALTASTLTATAQKYDVPMHYELQTDADFAMYEPQVVTTADWLQQTGWKDKREKRQAARLFILAWAQGTRSVPIVINKSVNNLTDQNPELLFTYTSQFAKYAIQHKSDFDKNTANLVALRAMLAKYSIEESHRRDEDVEKLIEINKEGNLASWIATDFK